MKINFVIALLFCSYLSFGQTIKLKNGIGITNLSAKNFPVLEKKIVVYSGSVGIEYLESEKSLINTELGYSQMGGKEDNPLILNEYSKFSKKWNYLFFLTTFRYKFLFENNYVYLGLGPEVNYLLNDKNDFKGTPYNDLYALKKINFGIVPEIGFVKEYNKLKYGLELSYMFDVSGVASSSANKLRSNNFKAGISLGYKF